MRARLPALPFLLVLALAAAGCSRNSKEPPPPLWEKLPPEVAVVKIDDWDISGAWLKNWCATQELLLLRQGLPLQVDEYSLILEGRRFLTKMNLVAKEAERMGLRVSDQEVQDRLAQEMSRFESTDQWRQRLEKSGLTVDQRKEQIRRELLFKKYEQEVLAPKVRERIEKEHLARHFYEKYRDQRFRRPRLVHLQVITRAVAGDAPEEMKEKERKKLEEARRRILAGEKFADLARELSTDAKAIEGGDYGWLPIDERWNAALREAIGRLKPGQVSPVVEGPVGFYLVRLVEEKPAGVLPFAKVKDDIEKQLYQQLMKIEMQNTIAALRQQADVRYLDLEPILGPPPKEAPKKHAGAAEGAGTAAAGQKGVTGSAPDRKLPPASGGR